MRKKTIKVFLLSLAVLTTCLFSKTQKALATNTIPEVDSTYDDTSDWTGTLEITTNQTIKLKNITHDNTDTIYRSPIKISNNSTVNIILEGTNILTGNPTQISSAGIEVESGSSVNIYGLADSSLTVTGGKYGAGIGGIGYASASEANPSAGAISIYSGTITAISGEKAAGIGSGHHSSASEIHIYGGNITALGTGGGAGIGSGYGTSGGSSLAAQMGYYNGGNITISGGIVKAAGWHADFDNLDVYNPETMYNANYSDTFAAGIGGGYGASSGNIVIEGDATVYALGSCGAAGIGTGRGTTKSNYYDSMSASCQVIIRGNASVYALAGKENRTSVIGETGGAGIGLGRGWSLDHDAPVGDVSIDENATVYAYAEAGANGIGGSVLVGRYTSIENGISYPGYAHLESLTIGEGATVVAISDHPLPQRNALDENFSLSDLGATEIIFDDEFYTQASIGDSLFFDSTMFPAKLSLMNPSQTLAPTFLPITHAGKVYATFHLPTAASSKGTYITVNDYTANNANVLLTNNIEDNGCMFYSGKSYDISSLQLDECSIHYNLNGGTNHGSNPSSYKVYNTPISLYEPTRNGYTFNGWYDNASFTGKSISTIPVGSHADVELWAKWTKNPEKPKEDTSGNTSNNTSGNTSNATSSNANKILIAKMTAKGKKDMKFSWNKIKGASGYDIYMVKCSDKSEKTSPKKIKTVSGNKTLNWTKKGLKKQQSYKGYVKAWTKVNGKKKYIATSPSVHAYTSGGTSKYTNPKSVTLKTTKKSIKKGKSYTIKATVNKLNKKKKLIPKGHAKPLRYISDNTKIATVNSSGKVTGKKKGSCTIYVYSVNGVSAKMKITVK